MHSKLLIKVDKVLWTSQVVVGWRWPETPPGWPQAGAVVAVLNTYKENFSKKILH